MDVPLGKDIGPQYTILTSESLQNSPRNDNYQLVRMKVAELLETISGLSGEVSMTVRQWDAVCGLKSKMEEFLQEESE